MKRAVAALLLCVCAAAAPAGESGASGPPSGLQVEVHPAGATVAENLLRIELRFSKAPRVPVDISQLRLTDGSGRGIPDALLDLVLPSADGRRFTVLLDPGRVKTGVGPNIAQGRALHEGMSVRLVLDHPEVKAQVVKVWTVSAPQMKSPEPAKWRVVAPRENGRDSLIVDLLQPISSTAEGMLAVRDAAGRRVAGSMRLERDDATWRFTPLKPWRAGRYEIVAHPDLEDPSGNRVCATFERVAQSEAPCGAASVRPFEIRHEPARRHGVNPVAMTVIGVFKSRQAHL